MPAQTVYALSAMQRLSIVVIVKSPGGLAQDAFSGVYQYFTLQGGLLEDHPVGLGHPNSVVPGIFDDNVVLITFLYGIQAVNPTYPFAGCWADFTFQVFGWGNA